MAFIKALVDAVGSTTLPVGKQLTDLLTLNKCLFSNKGRSTTSLRWFCFQNVYGLHVSAKFFCVG